MQNIFGLEKPSLFSDSDVKCLFDDDCDGKTCFYCKIPEKGPFDECLFDLEFKNEEKNLSSPTVSELTLECDESLEEEEDDISYSEDVLKKHITNETSSDDKVEEILYSESAFRKKYKPAFDLSKAKVLKKSSCKNVFINRMEYIKKHLRQDVFDEIMRETDFYNLDYVRQYSAIGLIRQRVYNRVTKAKKKHNK